MKTILLICAFAALAAAHPSEDVETDLLTPVNELEVVPETEFVTKPPHKSESGVPQCADLHDDAPSHSTYASGPKKGQRTMHKGLRSCLCIPDGKYAKYANTSPGGKGHKACFKYPAHILKKIKPSDRPKGCNDGWGMAWAKNCAPPKTKWWMNPVPKCSCVVDQGQGFHKGKHIYVHEGHKHGSVYNWKGKNFRGIHCQGCSLVKLYDDDKAKHHRQHKELSCCTGKTCDFTDARGWFHDLRDDLSKIKLVPKCPATENKAEIRKRRL